MRLELQKRENTIFSSVYQSPSSVFIHWHNLLFTDKSLLGAYTVTISALMELLLRSKTQRHGMYSTFRALVWCR